MSTATVARTRWRVRRRRRTWSPISSSFDLPVRGATNSATHWVGRGSEPACSGLRSQRI
ncbi:hypothetical protein ACWGI0_09995 [Streptomyces sp. NPDC054802]